LAETFSSNGQVTALKAGRIWAAGTTQANAETTPMLNVLRIAWRAAGRPARRFALQRYQLVPLIAAGQG
jgi:hypothetical protein